MLTEQRAHRNADGGFRRRASGPLRVGGVGKQEADATVATRQLTQQREVGVPAVDGREVKLEVAGVHDRAFGSEERDRETVRYRVRDRDELTVDRTDAHALTVGHGDELRAVEHA